MTRDEVIKEATENPEYPRICRKLLGNHPTHKDLYQELILILLEYPQSKFAIIPNLNQLKYFIVGILLRMAHSSTSPFHKLYRSSTQIGEAHFNTLQNEMQQEYDYESDEKLKQIEGVIGEIKWDEEYKPHEIGDTDPLDKYILYLYLKHGSVTKIQQHSNIDRSFAYRTIKKLRNKVIEQTKNISVLLMTQNENNGLKYHRQIAPHERLCTKYPHISVTSVKSENKVDDRNIEASIDIMSDEDLKKFNIIYYLRQISYTPGKAKETIERCHRLGLKVILDIDDDWKLHAKHMMYDKYKEIGVKKDTEETLSLVDHVITTTEIIAEKIRPLNPNVTILPNCINPEDKQWMSREIPSSRVRFGWIGGVYHRDDLAVISENFCRIPKDKDIRDKYQICLGGYNVIRSEHGLRPNPEYNEIEKYMSCNYHFRNWDATYTEYLFTYTATSEHITFDKEYRRLWAKDVNHYGELYNEIDVALVPLIPNAFNSCKSELKIVEAGWMKKPVIVSDVNPYTKWIKDGVNGIKVKPTQNNIGWYLAMKKLIREPNLRNDLAEALHETIKTHFDIDKHNEKRYELYKSLI